MYNMIQAYAVKIRMCDPSISSKEIFFIERIIYKMPHTLLPELAQDYTHLREYFPGTGH